MLLQQGTACRRSGTLTVAAASCYYCYLVAVSTLCHYTLWSRVHTCLCDFMSSVSEVYVRVCVHTRLCLAVLAQFQVRLCLLLPPDILMLDTCSCDAVIHTNSSLQLLAVACHCINELPELRTRLCIVYSHVHVRTVSKKRLCLMCSSGTVSATTSIVPPTAPGQL
jgi:hypothetical protein